VSRAKIVFAGTPEFSVPTLQFLIDAAVDLQAVYCQPDRPSGRGKKLLPCPIKHLAQESNIEVRQPESLRNDTEVAYLEDLKPDLMIVVAYGLILPKAILDIPKFGCINLHASLLPRWRGAAPIQRAIQAGDQISGTTLMKMDAGLDTGNIIAVSKTSINPHDTSTSLHDRLAHLNTELLAANLQNLLNNVTSGQPQSAENISYAEKISRAEGDIDWSQSAEYIERTIRAFDPWPGCRTKYNNVEFKIWAAQVVKSGPARAEPGSITQVDKTSFEIQCGTDTLRALTLQKSGSRRMPTSDFLNGVAFRINDRLSNAK